MIVYILDPIILVSISLQIKVFNYRHVYLILDGTRCNHINIENSECIYILKKYI